MAVVQQLPTGSALKHVRGSENLIGSHVPLVVLIQVLTLDLLVLIWDLLTQVLMLMTELEIKTLRHIFIFSVCRFVF